MSVALEHVPARFGPWLWGPRADLALFGGSALGSVALVAVARALGLAPGRLPEWGWLAFVVAVDVAHVWSTLFRTYLDREEVAQHRARYFGIPLAAYALGVALHLAGSLVFWRVLAYLALFHFVRQQVGWAAVYRARAGQRARIDRVVDDLALYASMLYPIVYWHAHLETTDFAWFVRGDFVDVGKWAARAVPACEALELVALAAFALRQLWLFGATRRLQLGKSVVVATTALLWWLGIVATNSDFEFTVTNVIIHGVPYFGLLWAYARERRRESPRTLGSEIAAGGVAAFMGLLLVIAFAEELGWDVLVWHDRPWLTGDHAVQLPALGLALVVPLLALPQATHYALDGLLWRRGDTGTRPAQRRALGFSE